jgi:Mitochondrial ribosomal protein (VAR1)
MKNTRALLGQYKEKAGDNLILKEKTYDFHNMSQFNLVLNKDIFPLNLGHRIGKIVENSFSFKHCYSMFYLYDVKFNNRHLLRLKNIIKRRYGKKVTLNIINLKYLYLDSNILGEAITTKLKDRTKRVLRVLKRIMGLVKTPYYKVHFYNKKRSLEQFKFNFSLLDKTLNLDIGTIDKDITNNHYLLTKPSNYKPRLLLGHLKHKTISGIRVEGSGRLTRRLTASRSISKYKYMGTLQNIDSSRESLSTVMLRGDMKSNLQYININSNNRNGAFGVKVSVSCY